MLLWLKWFQIADVDFKFYLFDILKVYFWCVLLGLYFNQRSFRNLELLQLRDLLRQRVVTLQAIVCLQWLTQDGLYYLKILIFQSEFTFMVMCICRDVYRFFIVRFLYSFGILIPDVCYFARVFNWHPLPYEGDEVIFERGFYPLVLFPERLLGWLLRFFGLERDLFCFFKLRHRSF